MSPPDEDGRTRIFLLDDHEIVRHGLRDLFESEDDLVVVGESGSAKEAERIIPALRPHVAVLDARLPDGSGIDVCRVDPLPRPLHPRASSSPPTTTTRPCSRPSWPAPPATC